MFALTTLVYPVVLALLCVGAGLLVDRCSGRWLPGLLLPTVGAAALIALSQLTTYVTRLAAATPYLMAVVALAGFALAWRRVQMLARNRRAWRWQAAAPVLAYVLALAPVLLAGRPTFSSYLTLSDSAFHMMGADFLMRHGQDFAHLDLRNSYGEYLNDYYNTGYPSGADTLFGGSAYLLGLPLIWAFQPFNAFMLATAAGPAWLLLRRMGLDGAWAALGALTATVPALVYGYELIGSIKEIASLGLILTLGTLVVMYPRWLRGRPTGAIPFALVAAAGISALGAGFGAWVLAAALVLAVVVCAGITADPSGGWRLLRLVAVAVPVTLVAALPTWVNISKSLNVAQNIAVTGAPGNLATPLKATQVFGVWLWESYKHPPVGSDLAITAVLIAITVAAVLVGALRTIRRRDYSLLGWAALTVAVWGAITAYSTTWVDAKTLMLTTPVVVLVAWGGVAAARASPLRLAAPVLAFVLFGGVIASDAMQYHASDVAPTARYEELESIDRRFAGRGPTLFTDFDEYSMYVLRDLDVGGPNFIYGPAAFSGTSARYRYPVELDRLPPASLRSYPLIVTRRDPALARPPAAYRLLWQGTYYQVWGRRPGAARSIAAVALSGSPKAQCARIERVAGVARQHGERLVAAATPEIVRIVLPRASHPRSWGRVRRGLQLSTPGRLSATFELPHAGTWDVWLEGQIMPTVSLSVDGRRLASIGGQLGGNSVVLNPMAPVAISLSAGRHRLSLARGGFTLAPGEGGSAYLYGLFLAPAGRAAAQQPLRSVSAGRWRSLCGRSYQWVEAVAT
ncbi:MAG: hypothetical protein JWN10_819 [Solirubrobacterales bacterium]|nr:hypothetical protein [Solirubrobacterales bacterium]